MRAKYKFPFNARERALTTKRLRALAAFLAKLPKERFDYQKWVGLDWKGDPGLKCGTTGCALGWAATMPEFRRLGLKLLLPVSDDSERRMHWWETPSFIYKGIRRIPFDVAERVFKVTRAEAEFLFCPGTRYAGRASPGLDDPTLVTPGPTPQEVAAHIRRFVRDRERLYRHYMSTP